MQTNVGFDENTFIVVTAQIVTPNGGRLPAWLLEAPSLLCLARGQDAMRKAAGSLSIGRAPRRAGQSRANAKRRQQHSQAGKSGEEARHRRARSTILSSSVG